MDEYIERRAAHDAVVDAIWYGKRSMYSVANAINSVPNADVAPVRHGRWVIVDDGVMIGDGKHMECSECHIWKIDRIKTDYCPNCGAKMDGDD